LAALPPRAIALALKPRIIHRKYADLIDALDAEGD
jgi:hypothetical protein